MVLVMCTIECVEGCLWRDFFNKQELYFGAPPFFQA